MSRAAAALLSLRLAARGSRKGLLTLAVTLLALLPSERAAAYAFISTAGCPAGMGASWPSTSNWYLNEDGYSKLSFGTVEATMLASIGAWSEPCCSTFRSSYQGTTTQTAISNSPRHVVSFAEESWPREIGGQRSTIAVTLSSVSFDCTVAQADMLFNGVGFTFRTNGSSTDLQAVATHEFGHWVGLDHTNVAGSTMLAYYQGGTQGRQLGPDDQAGVCALYPGWCETCTDARDCPDGFTCVDRSCQQPSCRSNDDCDPGTICSADVCVPGCRTHLECEEGESCEAGSCRRPMSECTICAGCNQDSDCGSSQAYHCVDMGNSVGQCTKSCESSDDCDGDSACWEVQSGRSTFRLCLAPDPGPGELCPSDYVCELDPVEPAGSCPGVWDFCALGKQGCGGRSDYCIQTGANAKCSCTCRSDEECGEGQRCLADPATGTPVCYLESLLDPCGTELCQPGLYCLDDRCAALCGGKACRSGQICEDEVCITPCGPCADGHICDPQTGACVDPNPEEPEPEPDPCDALVCDEGRICVDGVCVPSQPHPHDSCGDRCPQGTVCVQGVCLVDKGSPDGSKKKGGGCSSSGTASDGGIALLGLGVLMASLRRRGRG